MYNFITLTRARYWSFRNAFINLITQSKLKFIVILTASIAFWLVFYYIFAGSYKFLARFPDIGVDWITEYLFGLLFFALTLMLIISNAIIGFSGLYKSRETNFLLSYPVTAESLFSYKLMESVGFSSWAFVFLVTPLIFAYGINRNLPSSFYPMSVLFILIYIMIPAGIGSLISLLVAHFFPRRKKEIVISVIILIVIAILVVISEFSKLRGIALPFTERWMEGLLGKFAFTQNPLLPSYWLVQGIIASARGDTSRMIFFLLFLLAQSFFLLLIINQFARRFFLPSYSRIQSAKRSRKYPVFGWIDRIGQMTTFFLSQPLRQIILKDLKSLIRDPAQWSQFLVLFGLLAVYFFNLRNITYMNITGKFWQYLVSFLNLIATSLTLATFTTRFIYPQLSLEGQRFWIIGLAPISRKTIVYGKFLFALIGSLLVSESLIFVSNWMLRTPLFYMLIQIYTVFIICLGLSAMAVGLGALYPNLREDNPSKIVSGFGGTLTLVLSMIFVLLIIIVEAIPPHLYYAFHWMSPSNFHFWWLITTGLITLIGLLITFLPLHYGLKAIEKMDV